MWPYNLEHAVVTFISVHACMLVNCTVAPPRAKEIYEYIAT